MASPFRAKAEERALAVKKKEEESGNDAQAQAKRVCSAQAKQLAKLDGNVEFVKDGLLINEKLLKFFGAECFQTPCLRVSRSSCPIRTHSRMRMRKTGHIQHSSSSRPWGETPNMPSFNATAFRLGLKSTPSYAVCHTSSRCPGRQLRQSFGSKQ